MRTCLSALAVVVLGIGWQQFNHTVDRVQDWGQTHLECMPGAAWDTWYVDVIPRNLEVGRTYRVRLHVYTSTTSNFDYVVDAVDITDADEGKTLILEGTTMHPSLNHDDSHVGYKYRMSIHFTNVQPGDEDTRYTGDYTVSGFEES